MAATLTRFDAILEELNRAYRRVEASQDSTVKLPAAEMNLLAVLEKVRDFINAVLISGDRGTLIEIFGGDCKRLAHVDTMLGALKLSEMNAGDQRLHMCKNACASVSQVLNDLGLEEELAKAEAEATEELAAGTLAPLPPPDEAPPTASAEAALLEEVVEAAPLEVVEAPAVDPTMMCKLGCGRPVAPGTTRQGKTFDTCCRSCALGQGHDKTCGTVNPKSFGAGLCNNGCGRPHAKGTDSSGQAFVTCCRACAKKQGHDPLCGMDVGASDVPYVVIDDSPFFQTANSSLTTVQFNELLESIRSLNKHQLTVEQFEVEVRKIIGEESGELATQFDGLLAKAAEAFEARLKAAVKEARK